MLKMFYNIWPRTWSRRERKKIHFLASTKIYLFFFLPKWSKKYQNSVKNENPPHIFAVGDFTYQAMMHNHTNQCIIISGESGSGKTESANLLLQQLTILGRVIIRQFSKIFFLMIFFNHSLKKRLQRNVWKKKYYK